ncbi:hypothetical protein JCM13591A_04190 [Microbacterium xylanilyticum]
MFMEKSPKGRQIGELIGSPRTISDRGDAIEKLGNKMIESATFLQSLADQASGQKGEAIKKLQEVVGDTYKQLKLAGELYQPTGPVLKAYGETLGQVQPRLNAAARECVTRWAAFDGADGYMPGARPTYGAPKEGTPEATANTEADADKKQKHDAFLEEARVFDSEYDTWETAFDTAVNGITQATSGKIKDGFWDDVDGFVAGALEVLKVVGIIVGIAAIIIGGPILAAIAVAVGLLTLIGTAYQFSRGDANGWDLALAIVGVIPFGSAGKLFQAGKRLDFLGDIVSKSNFAKWGAEGRSIKTLFAEGGGGVRGTLNALKGNYLANNPAGPADAITRLMLNKDTKQLTDIATDIATKTGAARGSAVYQLAYQMVQGPWKLADNVTKWTGQPDSGLSKRFPVIGALM